MTGYLDIIHDREKYRVRGFTDKDTPRIWTKEYGTLDYAELRKLEADRQRQFNDMRIELCRYAIMPEKKLHFERLSEGVHDGNPRTILAVNQNDPAGYTFTFVARECRAGRMRPDEVVSDRFLLGRIW
jgi:hypothetical protein